MTSNAETSRPQLSYSSSMLLQSCESKYWHKKIGNTPIDEDATVDTEAFDLGKAFHQYLEDTMHRPEPINEVTLKEIAINHNVMSEYFLLHAMLSRYLTMHGASELEAVKCELQISSPTVMGYIDVLLVDTTLNEWWIGDMKTAARVDNYTVAKLPFDYQLNLYASFAEKIESLIPELQGKRFAGCRYRVTTKTRISKKANESEEVFSSRVRGSIDSFDIVVPKEVLHIEEIESLHKEMYESAEELRLGRAPKKNVGACNNYFRPCEFWSQCHGATFSESTKKVYKLTAQQLKQNREMDL